MRPHEGLFCYYEVMQLNHRKLKVDEEGLYCEFAIKQRNAVILHGAGKAERTRYYSIARELFSNGIGVIMFDFSGHGDSTGKISELSLSRRKIQAQAVIDELVPAESKLYLLGFSMSAQTVCDLLDIYTERIEAILLGCPAIYTNEVTDLTFGDSRFTTKLREENSWMQSTAPLELKSFRGITIIAIGGNDDVIPKGVVKLLKDVTQNLNYNEYPGVSHQLAKWLSENPRELSELIEILLNPSR